MAFEVQEGVVFAGRYQVVRRLAAGAMGAVYEVIHLETQRRRALKVMHPHIADRAELRERFKLEAQAAAHIDSELIVDVFDAGVDEATGMPFLVMELLRGEGLDQRLKRAGRLPAVEAMTYLHQLALALDKTHKASIVHRDLKPSNLFLTEPEHGPPRIKVLDFGVAKLLAEGTAGSTATVGTPLYMAPEQLRGGAVTPAVDLYALGMMAYTLLVGEAYWAEEAEQRGGVVGFALAAMRGPEEAASARAAKRGVVLPEAFDAWFAQAAAADPAQRFTSAIEAVRALGEALGVAVTMGETPKPPAQPVPAAPPPLSSPGSTGGARIDPVASTRLASPARESTRPEPTSPTLEGTEALRPTSPTVEGTQERPPTGEAAPPARAPTVTATPPPAAPRGRRRARLVVAVATLAIAGSAILVYAPRVLTRGALPAPPPASGPAGFKLDGDDKDDHDTVWRIPLGDSPRRGGKEPLVTVVEFADFECPYARAFEDQTQKMLATYGDDIAIVWKDLVLDLHPIAEPAARLARLARAELGEDGFWRAHEKLFAACRENDGDEILKVGRELGLPPEKVRAAVDGPTPDAIEQDCALAIKLGDIGTPTSFFNGRIVSGSHPFDEVKPLIDQEIAKAKKLLASGVPRAKIYDELQKGAKESAVRERRIVEIPDDGPVIAGKHAVIDVHDFGDETQYVARLMQPVVDYVLHDYGDKIRFHWHWVPDPSNETSKRVATLSEVIYQSNGSEAFWNFHRALLDNVVFPFPFKTGAPRPPRGFGDDALKEIMHEAGATLLNVDVSKLQQKPGRWDRLRAVLKAGDDGLGTALYAGGYFFGGTRRYAKLVLDQLIAEAEAKK